MRIVKSILLLVMAIGYLLAGINHFLNPSLYLRIIPSFIPFPQIINWFTGVAEVLLALLLLLRRTRSGAAWGIIILLVVVFPANIKMAVDYTTQHHAKAWITWLRLPLQAILIWWAYIYTNHTSIELPLKN